MVLLLGLSLAGNLTQNSRCMVVKYFNEQDRIPSPGPERFYPPSYRPPTLPTTRGCHLFLTPNYATPLPRPKPTLTPSLFLQVNFYFLCSRPQAVPRYRAPRPTWCRPFSRPTYDYFLPKPLPIGYPTRSEPVMFCPLSCRLRAVHTYWIPTPKGCRLTDIHSTNSGPRYDTLRL